MTPLSVVIITYNEERNIGRCIDSVLPIADEIIILDSFSQDNTVKIAYEKGAIIKQSTFEGYINQKNMAISLASNNYVLLMDADESLTTQLCQSIKDEKLDFKFKAYSMKRCSRFCGIFIKYGLWYPDKKIRLFDKTIGICGGFNPHDRIILDNDIKVRELKGDLLHFAFDSFEEYYSRNEEVSSIAAKSLYEADIKPPWTKIILSPCWAFINGYLFRLGFLNGYRGFIIALYTSKQSYAKYYKLKQLKKQTYKRLIWNNLET